jgi:hypothetical protein
MVLVAIAAAMAIRVRESGDLDDIFNLPFARFELLRVDAHSQSRIVPIPENCRK